MSMDKLLEEMNTGRAANVVSSYLVPKLQKSIQDTTLQMINKYKQGGTDFIAEVAKLAYIHELIFQMERDSHRGERASEKLSQQTQPE